MDRVRLTGIRLEARHGVLAAEKARDQWFRIEVSVWGDFGAAARTDDLEKALDYARLHDLVVTEGRETSFDLIESLAEHLCRRVLEDLPARKVEVTVIKEKPPIPGFTGEASVILRRDRSWLEE